MKLHMIGQRGLSCGLVVTACIFTLFGCGQTAEDNRAVSAEQMKQTEDTESGKKDTKESQNDMPEYSKVEVYPFPDHRPVEVLDLEELDADTVQWLNAACAIQNGVNELDITQIGGVDAYNEIECNIIADVLENSWNVKDRASFIEVNEKLLTEGQRANFVKNVAQLKKDGIYTDTPKTAEKYYQEIKEKYEILSEQQAARMANSALWYQAYGIHALDAWDYTRAISVLGYAYAAEYITLDEYMSQAVLIGKTLQESYPDWEALGEGYLMGYLYWKPDLTDIEYTMRENKYKDYLKKADEEGPYHLAYTYDLKWEGQTLSKERRESIRTEGKRRADGVAENMIAESTHGYCQVVDSGFTYEKVDDTLKYYNAYVVVTNTSDKNLWLSNARYDFVDNDGKFLSTQLQYLSTAPNVLAPGEKGYLYDFGGAFKDGISDANGLKLSFDIETRDSHTKFQDYEVKDAHMNTSRHGYTVVTGKVFIPEDYKKSNGLNLYAVLYDKDGVVMDVTLGWNGDFEVGKWNDFEIIHSVYSDSQDISHPVDFELIARCYLYN